MTAAATLLRAGLLDGVRVLLASGEPPSRFGEAVIARCAELRAKPGRVVIDPTGDEAPPRPDTDVLVCGIRVVALLPGAGTEPAEVAELAAFLASPAGDYHSGSHFRMGRRETPCVNPPLGGGVLPLGVG